MRTLITDATYLAEDCSTWVKGSLLIENETIAALNPDPDRCGPVDQVISAQNQLVIPGLINAHSHSYTSFLKGTIDSVPLDIYMLHAFAGNTIRDAKAIEISTQLEAIQLLKFGVTSTVDHFMMRPQNTLEGLEAAVSGYRKAGLRAVIAPQYSDLPFSDTVPFEPGELPAAFKSLPSPMAPETYFALLKEAVDRYNTSRDIRFVCGVDGPQRCSDELMQMTADFEKKHRIGWHTHILETKTQAIAAYKKYGKGLIEYIADLGLLSERTTFVHYIWVTEKEKALVREHGVNIAHCPSSSLHLGSGVAPVDELVSKGDHVAIGTDGGNSGNLNLLEKIRLTADLHNLGQPDYEHWITADQALKLTYENGARVVMNPNIGKIKVGYDADLVFIDTNNLLWQPINNLTTQLVYMETGQNIVRVMVRGETVVLDGKSTRFDEMKLIEEANAIAKSLAPLVDQAFDRLKHQIPPYRKMYLREIRKNIGFNRFVRPFENIE